MTDDKLMEYGDDPADFGVDEVNAYVDSLPHSAVLDAAEVVEERDRVLNAERDGKNRSTIMSRWSDAEAETPGEPTVDVVLRHHWTDGKGKPHVPGETVSVDRATADTLTGSTFGTKAEATKA
jgi:hypothetical protein